MNFEESLKLETLNIKEDDIVVCYFDITKIKLEDARSIYSYLGNKFENKIVLLPMLTEINGWNKEKLKSFLIKTAEKL